MTDESVDDEVVAIRDLATTSGGAAHGVHVGVGGDRRLAQRTGARGRESGNGEAEAKRAHKREVQVGEGSEFGGGEDGEESRDVGAVERVETKFVRGRSVAEQCTFEGGATGGGEDALE